MKRTFLEKGIAHNRNCIVKMKAIEGIYKYSASRLKLTLAPAHPEEVFVSTERYGDFKNWLNKLHLQFRYAAGFKNELSVAPI